MPRPCISALTRSSSAAPARPSRVRERGARLVAARRVPPRARRSRSARLERSHRAAPRQLRVECAAQVRQAFLRLDAMLAGRVLERGEARLDPFLARGIGLERIGVPAQVRDRLATRDRGLIEQALGGGELRIEARQAAEQRPAPGPARRRRHRRRRPAGFPPVRCPRRDARARRCGGAPRRAAAARRSAGRARRVPPRSGPAGRAARRDRAASLREGLALEVEFAPATIGIAHRRHFGAEASALVEQVALVAAAASDWNSSWPWMSTSCSPSVRSACTGIACPLTQARLRPSATDAPAQHDFTLVRDLLLVRARPARRHCAATIEDCRSLRRVRHRGAPRRCRRDRPRRAAARRRGSTCRRRSRR